MLGRGQHENSVSIENEVAIKEAPQISNTKQLFSHKLLTGAGLEKASSTQYLSTKNLFSLNMLGEIDIKKAPLILNVSWRWHEKVFFIKIVRLLDLISQSGLAQKSYFYQKCQQGHLYSNLLQLNMLGKAGVKNFFPLKMLGKLGIKNTLQFNMLDGAGMKKLFSLKMLEGPGLKRLL